MTFFVTNPIRLKRGIDSQTGNSILIKVNQIGTLTETLDCIQMAHRAGYTCVIIIAAVKRKIPRLPTWRLEPTLGQIKTGSASRSDRIAKYNQLLRIEEALGGEATFLGKSAINAKS